MSRAGGNSSSSRRQVLMQVALRQKKKKLGRQGQVINMQAGVDVNRASVYVYRYTYIF